MNLQRRSFLLFLGATASSVALEPLFNQDKKSLLTLAENEINNAQIETIAVNLPELNFTPIKIPIPLEIENTLPSEQIQEYNSYEVKDDLVLPEEFTYELIAAWGDKVGDSRFGYNNDYLSFIEIAPNEGLLTINFEYISGKTWIKTYPLVIGEQLPFAEVKKEIEKKGKKGKIDAFNLRNNDPLKEKIRVISREGLIDQGIGVISIRRNSNGIWERTFSNADRRITGISGLDNPKQLLKATGPAVVVFKKSNKQGYDDKLGGKIIGTFQNCAGGTTPWGTVMSAEENFQDQVPEDVKADGSSFSPSSKEFLIDDEDVDGRGNVFGLAGNKYGWMVEIDPRNPNDYGTKHTWLGRYRHEAFGIRAEAGKNLAIYSGCDRRGGHLYKFISTGIIKDPKNKENSQLLEQGMLYGAKMYPNGTGEWIPLTLSTRVNPVLPSQVVGSLVTLPNPDRNLGGKIRITDDQEATAFAQEFPTLGDIYQGDTTEEIQGAILIDAHFAGNAAGITCTARPEDTIVTLDSSLYIAFTSGAPDQKNGGPDLKIFQGPKGETSYEYGWIMRLIEDNNDPSALTFHWKMFAMGGEPAKGGAGFANPDNIEIDKSGNLWIVTDMSTSTHNKAVPSRIKDGKPLTGKKLNGIFGNNSLWYIPSSGPFTGVAYPVAIGPMDSECTGPFFSEDEKTLFLSIQHPGEKGGIRENMASQEKEFELLTTSGQSFRQERLVPFGSNWPSGNSNEPPRPGIVAIRRRDNLPLTKI